MKQINEKMLAWILLLLALVINHFSYAEQYSAPFLHAKRFDSSGQLTGIISPDPDDSGPLRYQALRYTYYDDGLLKKIEQGELYSWEHETVAPQDWSSFDIFTTAIFSYDSYGRKIVDAVYGADLHLESLVQYSYDIRSRLACRAVRMNLDVADTELPGSACELQAEGQHGPDRITKYTYNHLNQVLKETRGWGSKNSHAYVTNEYVGNALISKTDASFGRTEYIYDQFQRITRVLYPKKDKHFAANPNDFVHYDYDNNDNIVHEIKRTGAVFNYTYDKNNRLVKKDGPGGSMDVAYAYDLRGLALITTFGSISSTGAMSGEGVKNAFDGFGNLTSSTTRMGGISRTLSYEYDLNGNRTRITHPDGNYFTYSFDGADRMGGVSEGASTNLVTVSYHANGRRKSISRTGGANTNFEFDNALRLKSYFHDFAAGTSNDMTSTFRYNPANQIIEQTISNNFAHYSGNQNITGFYQKNVLNQYKTIDGKPVSYDENGNLKEFAGRTYSYDEENRLISTTGSPSGSFRYDPLGRLFQITVGSSSKQFLYDGDALVAEYATDGALTRRYVNGDRVDEPWVQYNNAYLGSGRRYLMADHQGSIVAHASNSGSMLSRLTYDVYGIPGSNNIDRFGYTGQIWLKEFGLNFYKARMYSPVLGRFLQTDPVGYEDQMNLYAYVGNDPVNYVDPTGKYSVTYGGTSAPSMQAIQYACGGSSECMRQVSKDMLVAGAAVATIAIPDASDIVVAGIAGRAAMAGRAASSVSEVKKVTPNAEQASNINRFEKKIPANAKNSVELKELPNGGIAAQATSPGKVPGSKAVYEKQIDVDGKTVQATKTTYDPDGNIVHVKDKLNGGTFP